VSRVHQIRGGSKAIASMLKNHAWAKKRRNGLNNRGHSVRLVPGPLKAHPIQK
jgi:hypothetical protein